MPLPACPTAYKYMNGLMGAELARTWGVVLNIMLLTLPLVIGGVAVGLCWGGDDVSEMGNTGLSGLVHVRTVLFTWPYMCSFLVASKAMLAAASDGCAD